MIIHGLKPVSTLACKYHTVTLDTSNIQLSKHHSLVETNVAIMVSSMPAASGMSRESSLFRSFHKSNVSSNDHGSAKRQPYLRSFRQTRSLSAKSTLDRRGLSSESLRGLQLRPSDLDMERGNHHQHRMEDMGLSLMSGRGIIRTIQIDQESFNNMTIK
jgi:hypothetical protein